MIGIIGSGPAGLTAGYELSKEGKKVQIFEKDPKYVGGISRTETYKNFHFDIGGHRFFSKSQEVEDFWTEILGDEMLERPRSSRIYYGGKFYSYPLVALEALRNLGLFQSTLCVISFVYYQIFPIKDPKNFEEWVTNQFGKKLFLIFFKTYTEKVWGIPCDKISADWAAQRIKGLSLWSAIINSLFKPKAKTKDQVIKTLIDSFRYPKTGPGKMWEVCAEKIRGMGGEILMNTGIKKVVKRENDYFLVSTDDQEFGPYEYVISTAPLRELVNSLEPAVSQQTIESANGLNYRDFLTVVLICKDKDAFNDNWIYIHDPSVQVGRIQNFKSWSPFMVPDQEMACYGLEYFCFEGNDLWNAKNEDLIQLGIKEMVKIGLLNKDNFVDGYVVRQPKAYPVYDEIYKTHLTNIREGIKGFEGLYCVGRNGMHKYNNQDHSMMTAMLAAKNIIAGEQLYDVWNVNEDADYHEGGNRGDEKIVGRMVPNQVKSE